MKSGKPQKIEDQVHGRWYASTIFPVKDENMKETCLGVFSLDITDYKRKEQALLDSEEKYRVTFESITDSITVTRVKDGLYRYVNEGFCRQTGYSREEVLGKTPSDINLYANPDERERFIGILESDGKAENVVVSFRRKSGEVYESEFSARFISYAGEACLLAQSRDITDRRRAENALKESEVFLENLTDIAYSADTCGNVIWVNSAIEHITGFSKLDIMGKPFLPLFMEKDHGSLMDVYTRTLKGESLENTLTFITGVTCEFTSLPRRDTEGKIVGTFGIARDITEKRSSQEALKVSKDRLKRAQRVAKIGSWEYDIKTEKVWGSEEAFRIYGIERKTPFLPLDEVEDHILEAERVNKSLVDLITRNEPYDIEFEIKLENRPGLTSIHSIAELISDAQGNPLKVLGVIQDITEQKQMRKELQESEEKYRAIFENKGTASGIFGEDGIILECNAVFEELSGYKKAEVVQKMKWSDFVVPEDLERLLSYDAKRSKNGESPPPQYECRITTKAGDIKTVIVNINLVDVHRIVTLTDITARKQAENERENLQAQLLQAQKMESIGTLAGGIAHDFNNLLSSILGYSELSLLDIPPESPLRNKLEAVYASGKKAQELVAQILAFSRNDEQVRTPIDLHLVIEDALKLLHHAIPSTIHIQTKVDDNCRMIGDPSRINQVIMNLCTNAYQAMLETGGTLQIALSRTEMAGKASELAGIPDGFYGKLVVADSGMGIPEEQLERIFEPYFTTKEKGKGTGLGLAVVHGIIKSHKGAILVKSEVGKGTQFEVYLPLTWAEKTENHQTEKKFTGGSESILLVDDQEDVLQIETEMLEMLGYDVTGMISATEALDHFAEHSHQYDLVITDMTMPHMTGDKLAKELKRIRSNMPIIMFTGFSELISREKAKSMGIEGFLTKPVQLSQMAAMIRKVIDGKPG